MADPVQTALLSDGLDNRTESELLLAIAHRDELALELLFQRFGGRVLAYVRALGGWNFPAEDALQEIFLILWQKASLFSPGSGSAEAWIFTVTRHKVFDILRAQRSIKEDVDLDLERRSVQGSQAHLETEDALSLQKALSMLPVEQRTPVQLAYMGGMTYEETARHLGLPLGTTKSRIRSGLSALKKLLAFPTPGGRP